ncbi:hypothetical protein GCM10009836_60900 [Pseudonocardia ailaonensis]|uniref:Secreted protein n=1 Tax=Pseudonocardia ailaonensis TaxID=367279 RepID=A0ABN2NKC2_9PSEU
MTPAWLTILVALLGLSGVLVTQLVANRREDLRWRREREREQQIWSREDAVRSYERRTAAYLEFIDVYQQQWTAASAADGATHDHLVPVATRLTEVELFGTREAAELAETALHTFHTALFRNGAMPDDVLDAFTKQVRKDLSVPD